MSPEQAADLALTSATDWYSVGVMLFEALTGRRPFEGAPDRVLGRKQDEEAPAPRSLVPSVPRDLDALCVGLLARDPAARPDGRKVLAVLGVSPSRATEELARRASMGAFVGRHAELAELGEAFAASRSHGVTVFVAGESGVGKTQLIRHALARLAPETVILEGRCHERETLPYKALDAVVDSLTSALLRLPESRLANVIPPDVAPLARLFPVLRRVRTLTERCVGAILSPDPHELRRRAFNALRRLLRGLARVHPVVIWIDDLHWGDADSAVFLADLVHAPESLLILFTHRADDPSRVVAIVQDGGAHSTVADVRFMKVGPLPHVDCVELARHLLAVDGGASPEIVDAVVRESAGQPSLLQELVRHVRLHAGLAPSRISLDDVVRARIDELDEGPRRILDVLAIAGIALRHTTVMRAVEVDTGELASHLRSLDGAHLVRTGMRGGEEIVATAHDRVRDVVITGLSAEERRASHERIARALEATAEQDVDALATQWLAAGDTARGLTYLLEAADRAHGSLAFERAAELYARALPLFDTESDRRQQARVRLADAYANAGRGFQAARAFADAAAHAPREEAHDFRRAQAEQLLHGGRINEGEAVLLEVLAAVGLRMPRSPVTALISLVAGRARLRLRGLSFVERAEADIPRAQLARVDACRGIALLLTSVDSVRAAYFQTKTMLFALEAGEPSRVAHALTVDATLLGAGGPAGRIASARALAQAAALADRLGNAQLQGSVLIARGFSDFLQGRFRDASANATKGVELLRERSHGALWDMRTGELVRLWSLTWRGELAELAREADVFVRGADARGDLYSTTTVRGGPPSIVWLRGDDPAAARTLVRDASSQWTQRGYHNQHYWSMYAETQIDLYEGNGVVVLERLAAHWPRMRRSLMLSVQVILMEATFARARAAILAAAERPALEAKMYKRAARDAHALGKSDAPYGTAMSDLILASLAVARGDHEDAVVRLRAAAAGFDAAAMRLCAEATRWRLGQLLGASGRPLIEAAEQWAHGEGVVNPARMLTMVAPGFVVSASARRRLAAG